MGKIGVIILLLAVSCQQQPLYAQKHSDTADDILQYVPYTSVLALKACGVESRDGWVKLAVTTAASWVVTGSMGYVLKHTIHEERPDHTDMRSFPSGHSMFAFAGATMLRREYGKASPWIPAAGYVLATTVAVNRVAHDRHHWYDALAGAGLGVVTGELTYWLSDLAFRKFAKKREHLAVAYMGNRLDVAVRW